MQSNSRTWASRTVEATPPLVDATRIEASTRLAPEVAAGLPNNGRNFLNLTPPTPNVAIVQGPDGDELTVAGQRGIHNNLAVDGADFNNPFFGEHRGGQRPPFTFNLDAVQEIVVVAGGANAEFGRSSGGFVNVITRSGTNQLRGTAHYFGKYDAISGTPEHAGVTFDPDFTQHQLGFTLGGPLKRDKAFFFLAYDQQVYDEVKQKSRPQSGELTTLLAWMDTAYGGVLDDDFGPIARTNDARALLAKFDFRLSDRHNLSLKYNHTWSEQLNGTFDVDIWGRSANGLEKDFSNAGNLMLASYLSPAVTNEFRFQFSREDRPRPYRGPRSSALGANPADPPAARPFPDAAMGAGFRFGMPFFLPIDYYDTRVQVLDNVSIARGDHLIKFGAEWNRVESVQTFIGFANGRFIFNSVDGFLRYTEAGSAYVECPGEAPGAGSPRAGPTPCGVDGGGNPILPVGPVLLYLQQAGVDRSVRAAGTQSIPQHELALYLQDTWKPSPRWTVNYGLRWAAQIEPDPITPPESTFYAVYYDSVVTNSAGTHRFPSDGRIPSDWGMFQPRLGIAFDPDGGGRHVFRASAGVYHARIPGLNLASSRSTNGALGLTQFRNSALIPILGRPPAFDSLLPSQVSSTALDFTFPSVFVFDRDFRNPRTINLTVGYERQLGADLAGEISFTHARTDFLTRFIDVMYAFPRLLFVILVMSMLGAGLVLRVSRNERWKEKYLNDRHLAEWLRRRQFTVLLDACPGGVCVPGETSLRLYRGPEGWFRNAYQPVIDRVQQEAQRALPPGADVAPLLRHLPARERKLLYYRFVCGLPQSQIAEHLGISQMHVSRLLSRTLVWLRQRLEDDAPTPQPTE